MKRNLVRSFAFSALLLSTGETSAEDATTFQFEFDAVADRKALPLQLLSGKEAEFILIPSKPLTSPVKIDLSLTPFVSKQRNHSVMVKLIVPAGSETEARTEHTGITVQGAALPLRLAGAELPTLGKYTGSLILTPSGGKSQIYPLVLSRAGVSQPGILVLDQQTLQVDLTRPFLNSAEGKPAEFTVRAREKTGQWNLEGVSVRWEQAPSNAFDLERNVAFKFDGKETPGFSGPPLKPAERTISAGQQSTIGVVFRDLDVGTYTGTLRFTAVNSAADDAQKLSFTVRVRDSVWWALIVLAGALCFSFVTTKVFTFLRNRSALRQKINDLQRDWLATEPLGLPGAWVRAVLGQTDDLSRRFWLSGLDALENQVSAAAAVIDVLEGIPQLRRDVAGLPRLVKHRALASLDQIIRDLDPRALDAEIASRMKAKITELRGWLDRGQREALYWMRVSGAIRDLLDEVRVEDLPAKYRERCRRLVEALLVCLKKGLIGKPAGLLEIIDLDGSYARLKILWKWREMPDFSGLVDEIEKKPAPPLNKVLDRADELAWDRVKTACNKEHAKTPTAKILAPTAQDSETRQAYSPLFFRFSTGDKNLDHTHLVLHGLTYRWTFTRGEANSVIESCCPNVVEYAQGKGQLEVKVELFHAGEKPIEIVGPKLPIGESKRFLWKKGLERVEVISFCVGAIVAVVTGLSTYYFTNASFGSCRDYLSLFLWGAAVDQTKNALQLLQSYAAPQPKSA